MRIIDEGNLRTALTRIEIALCDEIPDDVSWHARS